MNPATKTKPAADRLPPLERVAKAEAALVEAQEASSKAGREHMERAERAKALLEQRARLVHDEPELVDHRGNPDPADPEKNPVQAIDNDLTKARAAATIAPVISFLITSPPVKWNR